MWIWYLNYQWQNLAQAYKEVSIVQQSQYRWRMLYGGMKLDQLKNYKDLGLENT